MHEVLNRKIIAGLLHDDDFCRLAFATIKPEHFTDATQWTLVSIAYKFFVKYGRAMREFSEKEITDHIESSRMSEDKAEILRHLFRELPFSRSDLDVVRQEVIEFARHQSLQSVLENFVDLQESGRATKSAVNKIIAAVEETQKIGDVCTLRPDLVTGFKERVNRRLSLSNQYIPTLIDPLDARFMGARRGELCSVMAPSGKGKSWFLTHIAQAAHFMGHNVLHVTYEMSADMIEERHDMMIAGIQREHLNEVKAIKKIRAAYHRAESFSGGGLIQVEWLPAGSPIAKTQQLIDTTIEATGRPLDVVCLDYGNLISPNHRTGSTYDDQGAVWEELTNVVKAYNCVVWVATQTNRSGAGAETLTEYEIGDSILKYNHSDIFIGFNRSLIRDSKGEWKQVDDEWGGDDDDRIRLHVMKHRSGRGDKYSINFMSDYSRGLMYSKRKTADKLAELEAGAVASVEATAQSGTGKDSIRRTIDRELKEMGVFE